MGPPAEFKWAESQSLALDGCQTSPNSLCGMRLIRVYLTRLMPKLSLTLYFLAACSGLAAAAETAPAAGPVTLKDHIKPVMEKYGKVTVYDTDGKVLQ